MSQSDMIKMLDKLGKTEGYGHIMSLVSALWRADARSRNEPVDGCLVPVCLNNLKRSHASVISHDLQVYDRIVENQLSTAEYGLSETDRQLIHKALSMYLNVLDMQNDPKDNPDNIEKLIERLKL